MLSSDKLKYINKLPLSQLNAKLHSLTMIQQNTSSEIEKKLAQKEAAYVRLKINNLAKEHQSQTLKIK